MPKLAKQMYTTSKGERKVNCYLVTIPKKVLSETNISEESNVSVYAKDNKIIIEETKFFNNGPKIKNKDLEKIVKEKGRRYVLTLYINERLNMTKKQLDYVLNYKEDKNGIKQN